MTVAGKLTSFPLLAELSNRFDHVPIVRDAEEFQRPRVRHRNFQSANPSDGGIQIVEAVLSDPQSDLRAEAA